MRAPTPPITGSRTFWGAPSGWCPCSRWTPSECSPCPPRTWSGDSSGVHCVAGSLPDWLVASAGGSCPGWSTLRAWTPGPSRCPAQTEPREGSCRFESRGSNLPVWTFQTWSCPRGGLACWEKGSQKWFGASGCSKSIWNWKLKTKSMLRRNGWGEGNRLAVTYLRHWNKKEKFPEINASWFFKANDKDSYSNVCV